MGEGEPFLNFGNVVDVLKQLGTQHPNSKLAMSTSGVKVGLLKQLAFEEFPVPFKLQISVHSTYNHVRSEIMPHAAPLNNVCSFLPEYINSGKDLEFNYVLLDGINDSEREAERLAEIANGITIKLNMLNPTPNSPYQFSTNFKSFCEALDKAGANYEFYKTNGSDINAACGQLSHSYE
jgi:23S rRNA (adenine2503-C2)-methyltransferase